MDQIDLNDMHAFRKMLTLNRVRGFINANDLSLFTTEELWQILDWLDDLLIEAGLMTQAVQKARVKKD